MKKSTLFLIILVAIFFTSTLVLLYLNLNKRPATTSTPTIGTIPTETPTPDPTIEWKTYRNEKYGFEFQHPTDKYYNESDSSSGHFFLYFYSPFAVTIERKISTSFNLAPKIGSTKIENILWNIYHSDTGADDRGGGERNYYVTTHGQYQYTFFGFQTKNKPILEKILSTFKFINQTGGPTPTAISSSKPTAAKILTYNVPSTWLTTADDLNLFQISYDPNLYSPVISAQRISLSSKGGGLDLDIKLLPYDGGSRHSFISQNIGFSSLPSTQEIEYSYGGKSGLILYGVDASGSNTVGMIIANNSKAWLIESQTPGQQLIEKQISTLMLR